MNTTNSTTDQVVNSAPTTRQKGGDEIAAELGTRVIESSEGELSTTTAAAPVNKAPVKKTYVCVCCSKVYGSREGRRKHMRKFHNEDEPYPVTMAVPAESVTRDVVIDLISECDAAVVVKVEADSVDESENALRSANACIASSPARFTYPRKRPRPYSCEVCAKTFLNFDGWRRHKLAHTDKYAMMSKCQVCDTQFASPYTMRRHRVQVHKISYFDENSSLYGSGNNSKAEDELIESVRTVIDGKKCLKCDQCEYSCELPSRFLEHYRRHTGERPFTCDQCGKQFRVRKFLKNHFKFVHEGVKAFECDICGRRFSDKRYTMSHRRIHTGEKPFVCDICGCAFAQNASLSVHKDRHAKVAKYKCPLCSKMFLYRGSMNLHVKRHYGQLSHQCDTCGKKFIDKKHLLRHVVVHSDERPFTCDVCGATFKLQKYLTQHMKVHRAK